MLGFCDARMLIDLLAYVEYLFKFYFFSESWYARARMPGCWNSEMLVDLLAKRSTIFQFFKFFSESWYARARMLGCWDAGMLG
jgi:hypothetical protein